MSDWLPDPKEPGFEYRDVGRPPIREYRRTVECEQRGHCWHTADGLPYTRSETDTDVHCCYCTATATLPKRVRSAAVRGIVEPGPRHGPNRGGA